MRHAPESIGLEFDTEARADIDQLVVAGRKHGRFLKRHRIADVIRKNGKLRFSISADGKCVSAVQGHSTSGIDIQHVEGEPPEFLFHGTASRFLATIGHAQFI